MKKLTKFLFVALIGCLFFASCSKEEVESTSVQQIDRIILLNEKGVIFDQYQYDVLNEMFIGKEPADKATTIKGTKESVEPNNSNGHNYYCTKSDDICYSK